MDNSNKTPSRRNSPPPPSPPRAGASIVSSPLEPAPVRHVQSNSQLLPHTNTNRLSASFGGGRSPVASIPSSPTSVHSTSSAIFERDIEPISLSPLITSLSPSSPTTNPTNTSPTIIPAPSSFARAHITDASVPTVLDSAAEILATINSSPSNSPGAHDEVENVTIVTPLSFSSAGGSTSLKSGFSSPDGRRAMSVVSSGFASGGGRSRSPSPGPGAGPRSGAERSRKASLLLNFAQQAHHAQGQSQTLGVSPPASPSKLPIIDTQMTNLGTGTPSIVTPTSVYYSSADTASSASSPTVEGLPDAEPSTASVTTPTPPSPRMSTLRPSPPRSNTLNAAEKRLSFLSYTDILSSTPSSTTPLSSLTTSARADVTPAHIPTVEASLFEGNGGPGGGGVEDEANLLVWRSNVVGDLMDEGGEWERQGLGMGLEERMDVIEMLSAGGAK
ncbi:hypothetical protein DL96DRAFT_1615061 [Flagelloscypha sp. PMI_526]|nr:hypothetical protein DL96DRAFT_1615061 [Flagelloscypha sp. PMI_526]